MASTLVSKPSFHARSISLPSRLHPVAEQLEQQLCRLRSSQSASSSSSSLNHNLNALNDLYSCVAEFLQLPQNQHANCVDETLDRSLRLLDICSISRDVLSKSKDGLQDIQSVLRRRCSGELSIASEAAEFLKNRKTIKKTIKKCLQSIKSAEKIDESNAMTEVEAITADSFKALLAYFGGAEVQSTKSRWSAVAKLVHHKSEKVASSSDIDALDATLSSFGQKKNSIDMSQIESLRSQMVKLESDIQELDEVLECLFRHLVKTRATLLNIISN